MGHRMWDIGQRGWDIIRASGRKQKQAVEDQDERTGSWQILSTNPYRKGARHSLSQSHIRFPAKPCRHSLP